ncbi:MAG: tetratricopeptide repeat protein [Planctomycetota bacterium]|nr:tetratricopeptide repeat protein [Planctomycetota bacterium]
MMGKTVTLAFLFLFFVGCNSVPYQKETITGTLREGQVAFLKGEYEKSSAIFKYLVEKDGSAESYYWLGRSLLGEGEYQEARKAFSKAASLYEDTYMKAQALFGEANASYFDGDYEAAAESYRKLSQSYPDKVPSEEVLVRWGKACQRAGLWDDASEVFKRLYREAATTDRIEFAEEGLRFCELRSFVIQVGVFENNISAQEVLERMVKLGYNDSRIEKLSRGGKSVFAVWVGSFSTYREACVALSRIRGAHQIEDALVKP